MKTNKEIREMLIIRSCMLDQMYVKQRDKRNILFCPMLVYSSNHVVPQNPDDQMYVRQRDKWKILFCLMSVYSSDHVVPQNPNEVHHYLKNTDALQLLIPPGATDENYKRYNWTDLESSAYSSKKSAFEAMYAKYIDPLQVTTPIRKQIAQFIKDLPAFCRPYYQKVKSCNSCTQQDASTFHFKFIPATPHHRTTSIEDECYAMIANAGTCRLKGKATTKEDSSRGKIPEGATGVEVAYKVIWKPGDPNLNEEPKMMPDSTFKYVQFTTSSFMLNFEDDETGAVVLVFCRWFIVGKPQFAGPWGQTIRKRIL